jgi:hypothetical protein
VKVSARTGLWTGLEAGLDGWGLQLSRRPVFAGKRSWPILTDSKTLLRSLCA